MLYIFRVWLIIFIFQTSSITYIGLFLWWYKQLRVFNPRGPKTQPWYDDRASYPNGNRWSCLFGIDVLTWCVLGNLMGQVPQRNAEPDLFQMVGGGISFSGNNWNFFRQLLFLEIRALASAVCLLSIHNALFLIYGFAFFSFLSKFVWYYVFFCLLSNYKVCTAVACETVPENPHH